MTGKPTTMRVAQLVETLSAGGAEALAVDVAEALAARGHVAHLIVVRAGGSFQDRISSSVVLHDLARPLFRGSQAARVVNFLSTGRILEKYLRANRIGVLQTHLPMANFLGLVMARRGACRVYATVHNNREFDYGDHPSALRRSLRRTAYRQMIRKCRSVIAVSDQVKASLVAQLSVPRERWDRIRVVPNGVPLPPLLSSAVRAERRAAWGVTEEEVLIVGAGRLNLQKNFSCLLDALALLSESNVSWRCLIAGEGDLHDELQKQSEGVGLGGRVRLVGLVRNLPDLLAAADIFCLPSSYEGLPLVLLEAMAASLPVVAFAIEGIAEVVTDGVHGHLVTPGDVVGLSVALGALIESEANRQRLGAAARQVVTDRHEFGGVIDKLETVYRS